MLPRHRYYRTLKQRVQLPAVGGGGGGLKTNTYSCSVITYSKNFRNIIHVSLTNRDNVIKAEMIFFLEISILNFGGRALC
jgi:hypothetical protein